MKQLKLPFVLLLLLFNAAVFAADVVLKDASPLIGEWRCTAESLREDGEKRPRKQLWTFGNDGIVKTVASHKDLSSTITLESKYTIENGKISMMALGRSKKKIYTVVKLEGDEMILNEAGLFLFFTRKK